MSGGGGSPSGGGGGASSGGRGGSRSGHPNESGGMGEKKTAHFATTGGLITMRYFTKYETSSNFDRLKKSLEELDAVSKVKFDKEKNELTFVYTGPFAGLVAIQNKTVKMRVPSELISHAYLVLKLKPRKEYDPETFRDKLKRLPGMKRVCCVKEKEADLWADLKTIDLEKILTAAEQSGCTATFKSHEKVVLNLKAEEGRDDYALKLGENSGILVVKSTGKTIVLQTRKKVRDFIFKDRAKKAGVEIESIERK